MTGFNGHFLDVRLCDFYVVYNETISTMSYRMS